MIMMRSQVPNLLSCSRIVFSGFFVLLYSASNADLYYLALSSLAFAHLTDQTDGRLARRWGVTSKRGSLLDGLADRTMYIAVVFAFVATRRLDPTLAWLVVSREFFLYGVRLMRQTDWYPIVGMHRRLALTHGITLQVWLATFLFADGVLLFKGKDWYALLGFQVLQSLLFFTALGVGYYYLWINVKVALDEASSKNSA
jgi:phosphatidylglycerophosphate synthase